MDSNTEPQIEFCRTMQEQVRESAHQIEFMQYTYVKHDYYMSTSWMLSSCLVIEIVNETHRG